MSQQWYVKASDKEFGPFTSGQMRKLAADGKLREGHLVSLDRGRWMEPARIKGLSTPVAHNCIPSILGADGQRAGEMETRVKIMGDDETGYFVDFYAQRVANLEEATEKFTSEAMSEALNCAYLAVGSVLVGVLLMFLGLVCIAIDTSVQGDGAPLNLIGASSVFAALVLVAPGFLYFSLLAISRLFAGRTVPKRKTPQDTIRTFFRSIKNKLWSRAYNCLTDSAMTLDHLEGPRTSYLQSEMPAIGTRSVEEFRAFWSQVPFRWNVHLRSLKSTSLREDAVCVTVPIEARWSVEYGDKRTTQTKQFDFQFVIVRKGDYWFLANGFFWPPGRITSGSENISPERLREKYTAPQAMQALCDKDAPVRKEAADALGARGAEAAEAASALAAACKDKDPWVRYKAVNALRAVGPDPTLSVPVFIKALDDEFSSVRSAAAKSLGTQGSDAKDAIAALTERLQDEHPYVARAARAALESIQKQPAELGILER